jgi:uncharacterized protein
MNPGGSLKLPDTIPGSSPVAAAERVASIDALRGAALGGVLMVNLLTGFRAPLSSHILGNNEPLGPGGSLLLVLMAAFVEFKAFSIFSFLFGAGVAIQSGRIQARSRTLFLIRRFLALLAIGLAHALLIWNGDILTLYAVCGLLLIPLLRLPKPVLLSLGLVLVAAPHVVPLPVPFPDNSLLRELSAEALNVYRTGPWRELLSFRLRETRLLILPLLLLSLPRTLGLMLWGAAAWRSGFFSNNQRLWRWMVVLGAAIGIVAQVLRNQELEVLSLAAAYTAALLLWNPRGAWIAAGGRMALTNYLVQSIVFGFVFYSYGLRWFGTVGVAAALAGGALLYLAQLAWSGWWLRRFWFGPAEWLWRSISYLEWQPFLREEARMVSRRSVRLLGVMTLAAALPLIHLGCPLLLARIGPRWGWSGGNPGAANLLGAIPILAGMALLAWIVRTVLVVWRSFPSRVRLGLRPLQLVQTGPYAWIRHPIYVVEGCFWAGMAVLLGSPVVILAVAVMVAAGLLWVVPSEEKALEKQFAGEYTAYRSRVPAVIPHLRRRSSAERTSPEP